MRNEAPVESSRLARSFSISLKQLTALVISVLVISAASYLTVQRLDVYKRWKSQFVESQSIRSHLWEAYVLLKSSSFETDNTKQYWFITELEYASSSLQELMRLDERHGLQLGRIETMLVDLFDPTRRSYLTGLNPTDRIVIARALYDIGGKVVAAYSNYLNYTSSNPPLWYFGPSPPDEATLEEAAELAIDIREDLP